MSFGRIIGGLVAHKLSGTAGRRVNSGMGGGGGGLDRMLGSVLSQGGKRGGGGAGGGGDLSTLARDFLGNKQAGGMSGGQIGGLGALAGAVFGGGGLRGAAKGGALAVLGTLALKAWRDHQAEAGKPAPEEASPEEAEAVTAPDTERLVLRAMIGAAQADGRIDDAEMDRILSRMDDDDATPEERRQAVEEAGKPVDVEALGREVSRPEVATEVYLAALLAIEIDTDAERDYLRRLAAALRIEPGLVGRLHRMTGAPAP